MNLINFITENLTANSFVLTTGLIVILGLIVLISANNSRGKRIKTNVVIITASVILLAAVLVYPRVLERSYVGKPDYECDPFQRTESGELIFTIRQLIDPATGALLFQNGQPVFDSFPKLKNYYFPLQDIRLQKGVLKIRLQTADKDGNIFEHYCAFDVFPKAVNGEVSEKSQKQNTREQQEIRKWYKKLEQFKDDLDKVNAVSKLSKMTDEEIDDLASKMQSDSDSNEMTQKAEDALSALQESIKKQQEAQKGKAEGKGDGETQGQNPQQSIQSGEGFQMTLPVTSKSRAEIKAKGGEEARSGNEENSPNPNESWESSNGFGKTSKELRERSAALKGN